MKPTAKSTSGAPAPRGGKSSPPQRKALPGRGESEKRPTVKMGEPFETKNTMGSWRAC